MFSVLLVGRKFGYCFFFTLKLNDCAKSNKRAGENQQIKLITAWSQLRNLQGRFQGQLDCKSCRVMCKPNKNNTYMHTDDGDCTIV